MVLLVLSPGKAAAFVAIPLALFGVYLGCTFAPNNKGMEMRGQQETGLRAPQGPNLPQRQRPFPGMPSVNLRRAKPIVRDFRARIGVPYAETSLVHSYRLALTHLHEAGAPLRRQRRPSV